METNETSGAVGSTVNHAAASAHDAITKASDAARPAVEGLASGAHHVVDKLAGSATHMAESLDAKGEQLQAAQSRLIETCRAHLRDHPVASLAVAVAAGYMLNWWLKQR